MEAAGPPYSLRSVAEHVGRQVDDPAAARALRVQMLVSRHRLQDVVRRQAAVEVDMAQHPCGGQTVERPVDGRAVHSGAAGRDLVEDLVRGQVLTCGGQHAAENRDPRFRHALPGSAQQSLGAIVEALPASRRSH
jgi:hypothetical protein